MRPFYLADCHVPVGRRTFLTAATAALTAGALGGRGAQAAPSTADGAAVIQRYAAATADPWAVAHGVRGLGREFAVEGGRRAVDFLLEDKLASVAANGKTALAFPIEVEVHPNSFLKTMLEAGVPLNYSFTREGRKHTLSEVVDGARLLFRPKLVMSEANALPWSLIAFSRTTPPVRGQWTNAWGETVDFDAVVERGLELLEQGSAPIAEAMKQGRPEPAKAPVLGYTCGGTHLIYGVTSALKAGYAGSNRPERMQQQIDVLVWRLGAESDLIDRFYKARASQPGAYWYEVDAKLKLLGHAEECLAFATRHRVATLTPVQRERRAVAVAALRRMLGDLEARGLADARALDKELYRQLIGDTCHARHGLTLAGGARPAPEPAGAPR